MADLNPSASPSSGGKRSKAPAPKVPTTGTPKLRMNPAGDHSPVNRTVGAVVSVVSVMALAPAIFLSNPSAPTTQSTGTRIRTIALSVTPTGHTTRVSMGVEGIAFTLNHAEAPVGDRLVIGFTNPGDQRHDLVSETGVSSGSLASGETEELDLGIISGDIEGWCSLPGHRELGTTLHVQAMGTSSSSSPSSGTSTSDSHAYHGRDHGQDAAADPVTPTVLMDYMETVDARDPVLSSATSEIRRHYTFTATEQTVNVASLLTRESWTLNGDAPGPILCGHIGDTFYIMFVNNGTMSHLLDFHAGLVTPDNVVRSIEPGQTLEYTFVAENVDIWLYRYSAMPMSIHIINDTFGAVTIDSTGLDKVDCGYIMTASELYLGTDGQPADTSLLSALQPNVMAFNGVPFRYKMHPTQTRTNECVCAQIVDVDPSLATTFHVVGTQFDTVWREGVYVIRGGGGGDGWEQVLTLSAAEGGFVGFVLLEAGHYTFVNHALPLVEKDRAGVFGVTD